jgi:hypothetical protein
MRANDLKQERKNHVYYAKINGNEDLKMLITVNAL